MAIGFLAGTSCLCGSLAAKPTRPTCCCARVRHHTNHLPGSHWLVHAPRPRSPGCRSTYPSPSARPQSMHVGLARVIECSVPFRHVAIRSTLTPDLAGRLSISGASFGPIRPCPNRLAALNEPADINRGPVKRTGASIGVTMRRRYSRWHAMIFGRRGSIGPKLRPHLVGPPWQRLTAAVRVNTHGDHPHVVPLRAGRKGRRFCSQ